jgi:hypothetical protein
LSSSHNDGDDMLPYDGCIASFRLGHALAIVVLPSYDGSTCYFPRLISASFILWLRFFGRIRLILTMLP